MQLGGALQLGGDLTRHLPAPGATLACRGWLDSRGPRGRGRRELWGCPCHMCTKAAHGSAGGGDR